METNNFLEIEMKNFKNELNTRNWSLSFDLKRLPILNDIIEFDGGDLTGGFKEVFSGKSKSLKEPSSRGTDYSDFTLGFIVDELMTNHEAMKEWLENNCPPEGKVKKDTTSGVFSLRNQDGKVLRQIKIFSCFPIGLTFPSFKTNDRGEIDNTAFLTLVYSKWDYVPLDKTKNFFN